MRILLIKMSSMGDVFHTFPALTDAMQAIPGLEVDWVVEEAFAEIPSWHPAVDQVFSIGLRRWRKHPFSKQTRIEKNTFFDKINKNQYDLVLDAQGLLKSAWVARKVSAPIAGLNWSSVREPLASLFYDDKYCVEKNQHAITRLRQLFAYALNYPYPETPINYALDHHTPQVGIRAWLPLKEVGEPPYVVCLHGTTWETKYWPEEYWQKLIAKLNAQGLKVVLPWGTEEEKLRSERLSKGLKDHQAWCPSNRMNIKDVARLLKHAKAVVSVDTGLSHVAAALETPMVVLYRVTDPVLVGATGQRVKHLCSPLASHYIKRFKSGQETASLDGLSVENVLNALARSTVQ